MISSSSKTTISLIERYAALQVLTNGEERVVVQRLIRIARKLRVAGRGFVFCSRFFHWIVIPRWTSVGAKELRFCSRGFHGSLQITTVMAAGINRRYLDCRGATQRGRMI